MAEQTRVWIRRDTDDQRPQRATNRFLASVHAGGGRVVGTAFASSAQAEDEAVVCTLCVTHEADGEVESLSDEEIEAGTRERERQVGWLG